MKSLKEHIRKVYKSIYENGHNSAHVIISATTLHIRYISSLTQNHCIVLNLLLCNAILTFL